MESERTVQRKEEGLVRPDGTPVDDGLCPKCQSDESKRETYNMFGGYRKTVCNKCGYELKAWRE